VYEILLLWNTVYLLCSYELTFMRTQGNLRAITAQGLNPDYFYVYAERCGDSGFTCWHSVPRGPELKLWKPNFSQDRYR